MKSMLKTALAPYDNRNYVGKKLSLIAYAIRWLPVLLLAGVVALNNLVIGGIMLAGALIFGVVDFFVFDALSDKIAWKLFWSHFYRSTTSPEQDKEFQAIRQFDINPTNDNLANLEATLSNDAAKQQKR